MIAGAISEGVAVEFLNYCKIFGSLPSMQEILTNPGQAAVPNAPGNLYAMTGFLGSNMDKDNLGLLMQYTSRLPREFQVVTMRECVRRNEKHKKHPAVMNWIADNAAVLY